MGPVRNNFLREQLEKIKKKEVNLSQQVDKLQGDIKNKESIIEKLNADKMRLNQNNTRINIELEKKDEKINNLQSEINELQVAKDSFAKQINEIQQEKEQKITRLQNIIDEMKLPGDNVAIIKKELKHLNLENSYLEKQLLQKQKDFVEINAKYNSLNLNHEYLTKEKERLTNQYLKEQEDKNKIKKELDTINRKMEAKFSPLKFSQYIGDVIKSFNSSEEESGSSIHYKIGEMDVDLKVEVAQDENNDMVFVAPGLTSSSKEVFSNFKFTVRAIPAELDN